MNTTNLTGPLTIPMTNDYLFRALLQQNNKVLKGLIKCTLKEENEQLTNQVNQLLADLEKLRSNQLPHH